METLKKVEGVLKQTGLKESDLSAKVKLDIKTLKAKQNTVNMQLAKGNNPVKALEDCKVLEDSIIESIVSQAEDKEEENPEEKPEEKPEKKEAKKPEEKPEEKPEKKEAPQPQKRVLSRLEKIGSGLRFWEDWD